MGRPLKIAKYNAGEGTWVDSGYPNNGTTNNGFNTDYPGVFGGIGNDYSIKARVAVEQKQYGTIYSTSGTTVIWGASNADFVNTLEAGSIVYADGITAAIGVVSSTSDVVTVTCDSAAASTDLITTKGGVAATDLVVNGPVVFAVDFAGLTAGVVYYVKTTPSGTTFSVSATPEGAAIQLTDDSDDVSATQATTATLATDATATVSASVWTSATPDTGYIVRQKGKKKFLVARNQTIQDEFITAGGSYYINAVSNTDWAALGAGPDAAVGKIFTAAVNGVGLTTNGTVLALGICTLTEAAEAALTRNQMSVLVDKASGSDTYASSVTDHFMLDFTNNGTDENAGAKYIASYDGKTLTVDPATGLTTVDTEYWC